MIQSPAIFNGYQRSSYLFGLSGFHVGEAGSIFYIYPTYPVQADPQDIQINVMQI